MRQNFYKESDPFFVEGIYWVLYVMKMNDREVTIGIKYAQGFDEVKLKRPDQVIYTKFSLLSLLSWVRLDCEGTLQEKLASSQVRASDYPLALGNMILSPSKSSLILRDLPLTLFEQLGIHSNMNVEVYFTMKHTLAAVMNYITANLYQYVRDKAVGSLKAEELATLLTHRKANVRSEDEVVDAITVWINANGVREKEVIMILQQVNWPYVSFDRLIELFKTFPQFRHI